MRFFQLNVAAVLVTLVGSAIAAPGCVHKCCNPFCDVWVCSGYQCPQVVAAPRTCYANRLEHSSDTKLSVGVSEDAANAHCWSIETVKL
jgi:hypothetical protein